ncbi:MAG TPA: hypothetical protein VM009_01250 [Terriglobales bacterium]|nr:hypothetical protein [Terriglobales bacterium]
MCVPAAYAAATDTDSGAGAAVNKMKVKAAVILPPTAADLRTARLKSARPGSATLSNIQQNDPHPLITEFFGPPTPSRRAKAEPSAAPTAPLPVRQAGLVEGPAE